VPDTDLDRSGCVDISPPQEFVGTSIEVTAGHEADQLDRFDLGAVLVGALSHLETCRFDARPIEIDQVHRHLRVPDRRQHHAERSNARQPTILLADLASDATGDGNVVGAKQQIDRDEGFARTDSSRAEFRVGRSRPDVRGACPKRLTASAWEIMTGFVGIVVEEDRDPVGLGPPLPELACGVTGEGSLRGGAAEPDEGDDVECPEERMNTVVRVDRNSSRDCVGQLACRPDCIVCAGAGECENGAVMVGIGV